MIPLIQIKLIFRTLGFTSHDLETLTPDDGTLCPSCLTRKTCNLAVLTPCQHKICSTCLDMCYDQEDRVNILCQCPICHHDVIDFIFESHSEPLGSVDSELITPEP